MPLGHFQLRFPSFPVALASLFQPDSCHAKRFSQVEELEQGLIASQVSNVYFYIDLDYFAIDNAFSSGDVKTFKDMSKEDIQSLLGIDRPCVDWILRRVEGITIALEPKHCGGLTASYRLLNHINNLYFRPGLFSSGDKHAEWRHLR